MMLYSAVAVLMCFTAYIINKVIYGGGPGRDALYGNDGLLMNRHTSSIIVVVQQ